MVDILLGMTTLPGTLIYMIRQDGYSVGKTTIVHKGRLCSYVDAGKDGHKWQIIALNRYQTACELMQQLGWDLIDG